MAHEHRMAGKLLGVVSLAVMCALAACTSPLTLAPRAFSAPRLLRNVRSCHMENASRNLRLRGGGAAAHLVASQEEFDKYIKESGDKLVVVDFTAKWCGPCQRIAPAYETMAAEFGNVVFLKVDVDELQSTAEACEVTCMPTFQFYREGKKMKTIEGASEDSLREAVQALSGAVAAA